MRNSKEGAALLITLLIIGTLSVVLIGSSRLTVRELRSVAALTDSSAAYFAAEAGVEDGLLRFRYNRDIELPAGASGATTEALRINLSEDQEIGTVELSTGGPAIPEAFNQYYDLKIWHKADQATLDILKDQFFEFTNFQTNTTVKLGFQRKSGLGQTRVEVKVVGPGGQERACIVPGCLVRLPGANLDVRQAVVPGGGRLIIRAFDNPVKLTLERISGDTAIDTGLTMIESTGYFGNVKRKLVATLNRTTGTVIDLFDFAVFSGQDGL